MTSSLLLRPFSALYSSLMSCRNLAYDTGLFRSSEATLPVICVGNATVGGSGKTPFSIYLCKLLLELGASPVLLTRGYRSKVSAPHIVSSSDSMELLGDEVIVQLQALQTTVPIVISPDRRLGAKLIAREELGNIIVMDDGYQHRKLRRDVNLLLIDFSTEARLREWQDATVLPEGRFREKPSEALSRASAVICVKRGGREAPVDASAFLPSLGVPAMTLFLGLGRVRDVFSGIESALGDIARVRVVTSIARGEDFTRMLGESGVSVVDEMHFPNHHSFTSDDFEKITNSLLPVFVTSKDAVKLKKFIEKPARVFEVTLDASLASGDKETLVAILRAGGVI